MSVEDTTTSALDVKIRNAGWHFMWLQDVYSHFATGRTAEPAISKAIKLALHQVKGRFNAAELYSINVRKYPGFQVAKVTLYARQIQQKASRLALLTRGLFGSSRRGKALCIWSARI